MFTGRMRIHLCAVLVLLSPAVVQAARFDCSGLKQHDEVVALLGAQASCAEAAAIWRGCSKSWDSSPEILDAALGVCESTFVDRLSEKQHDKYLDISETCAVKHQSPDTMKVYWPLVRACRVDEAEKWAKRYAVVAKPSFDCARAGSLAEKAICADPALAALDRELAAVYTKARKRTAKHKPLASALAADQKAFIGNRDTLIENRADLALGTSDEVRANYDVAGLLRARIDLLRRLQSKPRDAFAGSWGGAGGRVEIEANTGVFLVRLKAGRETLAPAKPDDWMCGFEAKGGMRGGELYVEPAELAGGAVLFGLEGVQLTVRVIDKEGKELGTGDAPPPFCNRNRTFRPGILLPLARE